MFSSLSNYLAFSLGGRNVKTIDIRPVKVSDVEVQKDKEGRTLKHLLKLNHANHVILYHDLQFHNHTPHILGSAYLLGAGAPHLEKIYEKETEELEKWHASPGEVSKHDWRDYLGKREYQRAFVDFFEDELVENGYNWRAVVNKYMFEGQAPLINNVIAGLAHPLIHMGYAFELNSKEVAMEALGLTTTCYNFLHKYLDDPAYTQNTVKSTTSPFNILQDIRNDPRFDDIFEGPGSENMDRLFQEREALVLEYWNSWDLTNPTKQFEDSQYTAACLLSATETFDFFFVHILTSSHAVRILLPFIPTKYHLSLVRQWWLFTLAVYIVQMRPQVDPDSVKSYDLKGRDWSWVEKCATEGDWAQDAHFIKALRALREAAQTWGDPNCLYLKAAVKFADNFDGWFGFA